MESPAFYLKKVIPSAYASLRKRIDMLSQF